MAPALHNIKETCLYIKDLSRARVFYEGVLGLKVIRYKPNRHLFIRIGSDVLLLFNADTTRVDQEMPAHYAYGQQHVAFECSQEDYQKWKHHLQENHIVIEQEISWPNGGLSFYFRDPEGLCLEIVQPGIWGF
jgi:catechol 2,3-dioxygenase-like lactoylglutathione lyase family enzyme